MQPSTASTHRPIYDLAAQYGVSSPSSPGDQKASVPGELRASSNGRSVTVRRHVNYRGRADNAGSCFAQMARAKHRQIAINDFQAVLSKSLYERSSKKISEGLFSQAVQQHVLTPLLKQHQGKLTVDLVHQLLKEEQNSFPGVQISAHGFPSLAKESTAKVAWDAPLGDSKGRGAGSGQSSPGGVIQDPGLHSGAAIEKNVPAEATADARSEVAFENIYSRLAPEARTPNTRGVISKLVDLIKNKRPDVLDYLMSSSVAIKNNYAMTINTRLEKNIEKAVNYISGMVRQDSTRSTYFHTVANAAFSQFFEQQS